MNTSPDDGRDWPAEIRRQVLVVASAELALLLTEPLSPLGEIRALNHTEAAAVLDACQQPALGLVVLDLTRASRPALELLKSLRASAAAKKLLVIVAANDAVLADQGVTLDPETRLALPFWPEELRARASSLLALPQPRPE